MSKFQTRLNEVLNLGFRVGFTKFALQNGFLNLYSPLQRGEDECELVKTLKTPTEMDPSTAWRRGVGCRPKPNSVDPVA